MAPIIPDMNLRSEIAWFLFRLPGGKTATRYAIFVGLNGAWPPPLIKDTLAAMGPDEVTVSRGGARNQQQTDHYQLSAQMRKAMEEQSKQEAQQP